VALDPDAEARAGSAAAIAWLRRAGMAVPGLRFVDPEAVHLTLRFLGNVPEEQVEGLAAAVAATAAGGPALRLQVRGLGAFPSPGRAQTVWLGVAGDLAPLEALAATLDRHLARLGFTEEARRFRPHLTVARARRGAHGLAAALAAGSAALAPISWHATTLTLFESHLGRDGARHLPLLRAPLGVPSKPETP